MRALALVLLSAGLAVGCSSSRYDRAGRAYPASARAGNGDGGQERYVVCHKGRNSLTLPEPAVRAHLDHGDRFGRCADRDRGNRGRRGRGTQGRGNRGRGNG